MLKKECYFGLENTHNAIIAGMERSLGFLLEYPLDSIKSRWQISESLSISQAIRNVYKTYGFFGYYHGFLPNLLKKVVPQFYRWPLLLQIPDYCDRVLEISKLTSNPYYVNFLSNLFAGFFIGSFETILASPFDTCRLELIVNREKIGSLLTYIKFTPWRQHFLGLDALFFKEIFGWSSFLVGCNLFRMVMHEINQDNTIRLYQIVAISPLVAAINAIVYLPWDVARTQIQKNKYSSDQKITSVFSTMKTIQESKGLKILWRGFGIRFFQMSIATSFSIPAMEKYEHSISAKK